MDKTIRVSQSLIQNDHHGHIVVDFLIILIIDMFRAFVTLFLVQ